MERTLVWLIAALVFAIPLIVWPGSTEYGYTKSILALIGISFLVVVWSLWSWQKGRWKIRVPWLMAPVVGLVVVSLLSLLGAVNGRVVLQSLTLVVFFALLGLIIANVVRERRDVTLILFSLLLASFLVALYGLLQSLGIMRGAGGGRGFQEIISSLGNRNYVGGFLAYGLIPCVLLVVRLRSRILRAAAIGMVAFDFGLAMMLHQSGIEIALIIGGVFLIVGLAIFRPVEPIRRNRGWLVALLAVLVVTFLIEAPSGPLNSVVGLSADGPSFFSRFWKRTSTDVRSEDWWVGWEMFKANPIVGVGLGNYKLNFLPYKAAFLATPQGAGFNSPFPRAAQAHNEYAQVIAELGVLGMLVLLGLVVGLPLCFWIRLRRNRDEADRFDLLLLAGGVVVFLAHAGVSFPAHLPASSMVLVVLLGLALSCAYGDATTWRVGLGGWFRGVVVVVLVALCVGVSVLAARDSVADLLLNRAIRGFQSRRMSNSEIEGMLHESERLDFAPRQVYYHLAMVDIKQGDYWDAVANLKRCLTRFVDESIHLNLANLTLNLGELATARESASLLLAINPYPETERQARFILALISMREGENAAAEAGLEELIDDYPDFERAYFALGELYRLWNRPGLARTPYEQALALVEPRLAEIRAFLSRPASLTAQRGAELQNELEMLVQIEQGIRAGLAALPPSVDEVPRLDASALPPTSRREVREIPSGATATWAIDVNIERSGGVYDEQLLAIARREVEQLIDERDVRAVAVAFWRDTDGEGGGTQVARVDWGPGGRLDVFPDVPLGDYTGYAFRVYANETGER